METKKIYESPEMKVLILKAQSRLMDSSNFHGEAAYLDNEKDPIV